MTGSLPHLRDPHQQPLSQPQPPSYLKYSTVTGYFLQDDPATDPSDFDYATTNLGLINRSYPTDDEYDPEGTKTQWQRFEYYVRHLQESSEQSVMYKVLYMARHGEGWHNVAEAFYGTEAWDCYWSMLPGNGTITWADAHLTKTGIAQAHLARDFWSSSLSSPDIRITAPESFYVSPLHRCLATAQHTFTGGGTEDLLPTPFVPTVKELLREALGVHTCDQRSSRSTIAKNFPSFRIEPDFSEDDPWWEADVRESDSHLRWRMKQLLDDIFTHDDKMFVSLTSHSGAITQILEALGHRRFELQTGGVIPVLVKAERVVGKEPEFVIEPGAPPPECPAHLLGDVVPLPN